MERGEKNREDAEGQINRYARGGGVVELNWA